MIKFKVRIFIETISMENLSKEFCRMMDMPCQPSMGMKIIFDPEGLQAFEHEVIGVWYNSLKYPDEICVQLEAIKADDMFESEEIALLERSSQWEEVH